MKPLADSRRDLTQGGITRALLRIALPIMGTQFMQMCYNLTDMFWLGRVGGDALAASGSGGLFMWLSVGLMLIGKVGAEIGVSHARGRGDTASAYRYAKTALYISAFLGVLYGAFLFFLRGPLVGFFNFREENVAADAAVYLGIMGLGIPFNFITASVGGSFNASGNSKTPFLINSMGLIFNMLLDPLFIFIFDMGIGGAAIASVIAQLIVMTVMLAAVKYSRGRPFEHYVILAWTGGKTGPAASGESDAANAPDSIAETIPVIKIIQQIFTWTTPIFLESTLFCFLTMLTSRFEVSFGAHGLAISRVGSQVESLTWLIGAGFGSALTAFVGQNFGAGQKERIDRGVKISMLLMTGWGVLVTAVLFLGGGLAFSVFLPDPALRETGIAYMRILAICQIPMNWEAAVGSAFKGKGRTLPPSVTSITSNVIRVPLAYVLSRTSLGLLGIWTAITISASLRGVWIWIWYWLAEKKSCKPS